MSWWLIMSPFVPCLPSSQDVLDYHLWMLALVRVKFPQVLNFLWMSIGVSGSLQSLQKNKQINKQTRMCQFSDVTAAATILLSPFIQSIGKNIQLTSAYAYFPGNFRTHYYFCLWKWRAERLKKDSEQWEKYYRSESYLYALLRWQPSLWSTDRKVSFPLHVSSWAALFFSFCFVFLWMSKIHFSAEWKRS